MDGRWGGGREGCSLVCSIRSFILIHVDAFGRSMNIDHRGGGEIAVLFSSPILPIGACFSSLLTRPRQPIQASLKWRVDRMGGVDLPSFLFGAALEKKSDKKFSSAQHFFKIQIAMHGVLVIALGLGVSSCTSVCVCVSSLLCIPSLLLPGRLIFLGKLS
ncbi:hypothetical protein E2320_004370, partial [Naja naja]